MQSTQSMLMRRHTIISEYPTTHVLSLQEAKEHLRVDDITPGAKATITKGTGDSALKLSAKYDGVYANQYTLTIVQAGNSTPLSVSVSAGDITVNLATNGGGTATSTVNDVIAALVNDTLISNKVTATANTGNGTGLLAAAAQASFTGGIDGVSASDDYVNALILAVEDQTQTILRSSLRPQTLQLRFDEFPFSSRTIYPHQSNIELDFGPIRAVNSITYLDVNGDSQTFPADRYDVDITSTPGVIALKPNLYWPYVQLARRNAVTIEYEAGYDDPDGEPSDPPRPLPEAIKQAMKLFIGHLYTNRESVQVGPGITTLEIPQAAMWLLWPYRDFRF